MRTACLFVLLASVMSAGSLVLQICNATDAPVAVAIESTDYRRDLFLSAGASARVTTSWGKSYQLTYANPSSAVTYYVGSLDVSGVDPDTATREVTRTLYVDSGSYVERSSISEGDMAGNSETDGYGVFLLGFAMAATVRLTRAGLRWVRAIGEPDHGGP